MEAEDLVWEYVSLMDMETWEKYTISQYSTVHRLSSVELGLVLSLAAVFLFVVFSCMTWHPGLVSY